MGEKNTKVGKCFFKYITCHSAIVDEKLNHSANQSMKSSGRHLIEATWSACQPEWHTAVYEIAPSVNVEGCIGSTLLCDFNSIKSCCKIEHRYPAVTTQSLLLRMDITLRHLEHLCNFVELHIICANPPLLRTIGSLEIW